MISSALIAVLTSTIAGIISGVVVHAICRNQPESTTAPVSAVERPPQQANVGTTVTVRHQSATGSDTYAPLLVTAAFAVAATAAYLRYFDTLVVAVASCAIAVSAFFVTLMLSALYKGPRSARPEGLRVGFWLLGAAIAGWCTWRIAHPSSEHLNHLLDRASARESMLPLEDLLSNGSEAFFHMLGYVATVALCIALIASMSETTARMALEGGARGAGVWQLLSRLGLGTSRLIALCLVLGVFSVGLVSGEAHSLYSRMVDDMTVEAPATDHKKDQQKHRDVHGGKEPTPRG